MTGNSFYDACRVFVKACAFGNVANMCANTPNNACDRTQWYTDPEIMNSAFSCELFMKALLIYRKFSLKEIKKIGHGLQGLWDAIYNEYDELKDVKQSLMEQHCLDTDEEFDELLKNISNAFVEWRYIYEKHGGKIHLGFLRDFQDALREACCKILYKMTWETYEKIKKQS